MTIGNQQVGSDWSPSYSYRVWNGADDPSHKSSENAYTADGLIQSRWLTELYIKSPFYPYGWVLETNPPSNYYTSGKKSLPADDANVDLKALSKLVDKIRGHSFNLGIAMAESRQTLELLINSGYAVYRLAWAIRKGDIREALRALKGLPGQHRPGLLRKQMEARDFSSAFLSLRYGWGPLLNDIYEALRFLESRQMGRRPLVFRASAKSSSTVNDMVGPGYMPATQSLLVGYKVVLKESVSVARSLGLDNPASVLWEKLPWSFVFDWFIPIGSYLDSWSILGRLEATHVRTVFKRSQAYKLGGPPDTSTKKYIGGGFSSLRWQIVRTPGGSIDVPLPSAKALRDVFSLGHIANAAALFHQMAAGDFSGRRLRG